MPPRPFRKAISDFSGGIVDFFSSRDLQDNQFQEVKNFSTETPGKIERIRSKIDASGDSPTNQFKIGQSAFTGVNSDANGKIANTQIYNRTLSSIEVLHNYNALKSRFE